jgi:DNA-binding transcriptional LysR family regulator
LGEELARRLEIDRGDVLRLVILDAGGQRPRFHYRSIRHRGTFATGFAEFDASWVLVDRRFLVRVPGFSGIPPFLRGSRLLATLPGLLANGQLRGFANCPVPVECPSMPMYMIWHMRYRHDPVHVWLRKELEDLVAQVLARTSPR